MPDDNELLPGRVLSTVETPPTERCPESDWAGRCQNPRGHAGYHTSLITGGPGVSSWAAAAPSPDPVSEVRGLREALEWFAWFARKSKGTVAEVTVRALEQNPYLRALTPAGPEERGEGLIDRCWPRCLTSDEHDERMVQRSKAGGRIIAVTATGMEGVGRRGHTYLVSDSDSPEERGEGLSERDRFFHDERAATSAPDTGTRPSYRLRHVVHAPDGLTYDPGHVVADTGAEERLRAALGGILLEAAEVIEHQHGDPHSALEAIIRRVRAVR